VRRWRVRRGMWMHARSCTGRVIVES
jgi:hypothetical protein